MYCGFLYRPLQMRIIRNGDLKNLTITLEDLIMENSTDPRSKTKRSTFKIPLNASARKKRAVENGVNVGPSAAPIPVANVTEAGLSSSIESDWKSVNVIPITKSEIQKRSSYEVLVRFLDVWCSLSLTCSYVLNIFFQVFQF